jgi:hypothetical protein
MRLGHGKRMTPGSDDLPKNAGDPFYNHSKLLNFLQLRP